MKRYLTNKQSIGRIVTVCAMLVANHVMAIDLHLHQPGDLEKAIKAKTHFDNASLPQVIAEERKRLKLVLESELTAVEENILARRDQELLYFIDNIESKDMFGRIKTNISARMNKIERNKELIETHINIKKELENNKVNYQLKLDAFSVNPKVTSLPVCDKSDGSLKIVESVENTLNDVEKFELKNLQGSCKKVSDTALRLKKSGYYSPFTKRISELQSILVVTKNNAASLSASYKAKQKALKQATESDPLGQRAKKAQQDLNEFFCKELPVLEAEAEQHLKNCASLEIELDKSDLRVTSFSAIEKLAVLREKQADLNEILTVLIEADAYLESDTEVPEDNLSRLSVLASVFKSFQNLDESTFASALQFEAEDLRLDLLSGQKQMERLETELDLLEQQEKSRLLEWEYLAGAEQIRNTLLTADNESPCSPAGLKQTDKEYQANLVLVLEKNDRNKKCKREIHRMLTALSNAWTLGTLPQQLAEYRRIALIHESALDSSEIAFHRWQNLLSIPIDQMVTLHGTGIKPEDMASFIQALGLGSIAAGVN